MAWTDEMVEGLRKMWKQGLTTNEIAKNLGVSKNSIVGKVHRLNLTARPSPIKKKDNSTAIKPTTTAVETENNVACTKTAKKVSTAVETNVKVSSFEKNTSTSACLKLTELDSHTCRWPIGDPRDDSFGFCGKKVRSGQTYCEEHSGLAYVKQNKK